MSERIGVLFMAYGGPDSLEEIPGYLADIRSGRVTSPEVLAEITNNYASIGGRSPINAITKQQVDAVIERLNAGSAAGPFVPYIGMRHWAPWIEEQVGRMIEDGVTRAVALVLAPHYSTMSIAKYQQKVREGLSMYMGDIAFEFIDSYHNAPGLIDALAERVREGIAQWPADAEDDVHVIFSAHSLPVRILAAGDPYQTQLHETARLVAERAGLPEANWSWCYQSAGRSPEPWLGPSMREHLSALAERGVRNVVSVPVGFVCDHVEILFDIDIDAQDAAKGLGMRLERPRALNDDPRFMDQLSSLVRDRARAAGWISS